MRISADALPPGPWNCKWCRSEDREFAEKYREDWGCDAETKHVQVRIPCPGSGPDCHYCGGADEFVYHRCPNSGVTSDTHRLMRAISFAKKGLWPVESSLDQSNAFMEAFQFVESAIAQIEEEEHARIRQNTPGSAKA